MKTTGKFLSGILLITSLFQSCKKGEGDPFISLQSRKARVEGDWKVTAYNETMTTSNNSGTTTSTSVFDGSTWTDTYTGTGTFTQSGTATYTFSFTKEGSYAMKRSITLTSGGSSSASTWEEEGKWDFLTGVGKLKNKEYIGLTPTKKTFISGSSTPGVSSYEGQNYDTWQITTLKNKEMIWHMEEIDSNSSSGGPGSSGSTTIDITFTQ